MQVTDEPISAPRAEPAARTLHKRFRWMLQARGDLTRSRCAATHPASGPRHLTTPSPCSSTWGQNQDELPRRDGNDQGPHYRQSQNDQPVRTTDALRDPPRSRNPHHHDPSRAHDRATTPKPRKPLPQRPYPRRRIAGDSPAAGQPVRPATTPAAARPPGDGRQHHPAHPTVCCLPRRTSWSPDEQITSRSGRSTRPPPPPTTSTPTYGLLREVWDRFTLMPGVSTTHHQGMTAKPLTSSQSIQPLTRLR
jgi:hypothetical protein